MSKLFAEATLASIVEGSSVLVTAIEELQRQGYSNTFSLAADMIVSASTKQVFYFKELIVDDIICCRDGGCEGFYIYALSNPRHHSKGILTILIPRQFERDII